MIQGQCNIMAYQELPNYDLPEYDLPNYELPNFENLNSNMETIIGNNKINKRLLCCI